MSGAGPGSTSGGGEGLSSTGGAGTFHVTVAGVASTFPARSTARTSTVWSPAATAGVYGEAQTVNGPPSSEHSNRDAGSEAPSVNVAPSRSIVVSGGWCRS